MSIGEYVPSVGEKFIFLGIKSTDVFLGDWRRGQANTGKVVVVEGVANIDLPYPFEIVLADRNTEHAVDRSIVVDCSELDFLKAKPLEEWE